MLITVGLMALAAPLVSPHDPNAMKPSERLSEPGVASVGGTAYLLGTDFLGRDVLSRIIYGARISLLVGIFAVLGAGSIGVVVGAVAGYYGKWVDEVLMRLVDMGLAVPGLLLALVIVMLLGAGMWNVVLVLSATGWLGFARVTRGVTLSVKERDFSGCPQLRGGGLSDHHPALDTKPDSTDYRPWQSAIGSLHLCGVLPIFSGSGCSAGDSNLGQHDSPGQVISRHFLVGEYPSRNRTHDHSARCFLLR